MSWRSFNNPSTRLPARQAGLTLIEMLVVIAIFTIITVIVLADLPTLKNRLSLDLLAEEVAVAIRQAQVYGAATRVFGGEFPSQGVYLPVTGDSFVLFANFIDPDDNKYDEGDGCGTPNTECREKFQLHGGVKIVDIQACDGEGACGSLLSIGNVIVLFIRPSSDAFFYDATGQTDFGSITFYPSYIKIKLFSEKSTDSRGIAIWRTGHIYTCRYFDNPDHPC